MARTLYWITNDLRIEDNPALNHALQSEFILPVYIHDPSQAWPIQGASAWYLQQSLVQLERAYENIALKLQLLLGNTFNELTRITHEEKITEIVCARAYTPTERNIQKALNDWCEKNGVTFKRFSSGLLAEPEKVKNKQGNYYKVYTPFSKYYFENTLRQPQNLCSQRTAQAINRRSMKLSELGLISKIAWAAKFPDHWNAGEEAANRDLSLAIDKKIKNYAKERDFMGKDGTSKLSAHLRFGELSPAQAWREITNTLDNEQAFPFLRQLVWREFQYHLLFHRPELAEQCFNDKFNQFAWKRNSSLLNSWQKAQTGYPIVDAAMKQLWHSGWMHNRARMIVASFLTKHLLISWQEGAKWFWDTLVDADLANNACGWQWTAGCGADAAPYFRIFNPITQGEKFDPDGHYTRQWLPELKDLSNKYLFHPWDAPEEELRQAGVKLGDNYPFPIVEHRAAREKALETYKGL